MEMDRVKREKAFGLEHLEVIEMSDEEHEHFKRNSKIRQSGSMPNLAKLDSIPNESNCEKGCQEKARRKHKLVFEQTTEEAVLWNVNYLIWLYMC